MAETEEYGERSYGPVGQDGENVEGQLDRLSAAAMQALLADVDGAGEVVLAETAEYASWPMPLPAIAELASEGLAASFDWKETSQEIVPAFEAMLNAHALPGLSDVERNVLTSLQQLFNGRRYFADF